MDVLYRNSPDELLPLPEPLEAFAQAWGRAAIAALVSTHVAEYGRRLETDWKGAHKSDRASFFQRVRGEARYGFDHIEATGRVAAYLVAAVALPDEPRAFMPGAQARTMAKAAPEFTRSCAS
jgi:hypothetical protein